MKRFWDSNYGGNGYDAVARRKGAPMEPPATVAPISSSRSTTTGLSAGALRSGGRMYSAIAEEIVALRCDGLESIRSLDGPVKNNAVIYVRDVS